MKGSPPSSPSGLGTEAFTHAGESGRFIGNDVSGATSQRPTTLQPRDDRLPLDAHSPVNPFSKQVRMAAVAGVLLDRVHENLSNGDLLVLVEKLHRRPEIPDSFDALLGGGDLLAPRIPGLGNNRRITDCTVEGGVRVLGCAVAAWCIFTREDVARATRRPRDGRDRGATCSTAE